MLGYGGVAGPEESCQFADGSFTVDELAEDQQPMAVGERLEKGARLIRRRRHEIGVHFHTCVSTHIRIYGQAPETQVCAESTTPGLRR